MSLIEYWSSQIASADEATRPFFVASAICAIGQENRAIPTPADVAGLGLSAAEIETILPGSARLVEAVLALEANNDPAPV